jgi:hypothetical protein
MTKVFGGPYNGTYVLAVTIFSLGIIRDLMYVFPLFLYPSSLLFPSPRLYIALVFHSVFP